MLKKTAVAAVLVGMLAGVAAADQLELTGVIRDMKRGDRSDGHPDFQTAQQLGGFGHVTGLVEQELGEDGKPVYAANRPNRDTVTSAETFAQWFRDVPEVNLSEPLTLTLNELGNQPGVYSFSSNAFWPINGKMFGNQGLGKNFHFTFELHTAFSYQPGQRFTFVGDDDVWVYINGKQVIDLGGVHSAVTGRVLLFDGKGFVEADDFPVGGLVKEVDSDYAGELAEKWAMLELGGSCPVVAGARFVDLGLKNGGSDVRADFTSDTSVTIFSTDKINRVVLSFVDGSEQMIDNLNVAKGAFAGSGFWEGKVLRSAFVTLSDGTQQKFATDGSATADHTLDFFFAERHTTQSNFRIDTSIDLQTVDPATISPLYD